MRSRALRATLSLFTATLAVTGALRAASAPARPVAQPGVHIAAVSPPALLAVPLGPPAPPSTTTTAAAPATTTLAPRHLAPVASRSAPLPVESQGVQSGANYSASYSTACYPAVGMAPRNGIEACISAREHGGCYDRSANLSHFGRWQLSRQLWSSYGGGPDWGYAPPAEQDQVFRNVVAADRYAPWTPYDGCG